jgi:transposase InsO family protein
MAAVTELATAVGTRAACRALFAPRASHYRQRHASICPAKTRPRPAPPRALALAERETILAHLHGERFQDRSPAAVYATLLDEGEYHCSIRTMYRLLAQRGESRERRDQLTHPPYQKPELLATAPNQLWSWDITKLLGPAKWTYFYLYVILDVFSRHADSLIMPTVNGIQMIGRRSRCVRSRHNQRVSKKAKSWSSGRYRPGLIPSASVCESAFSFKRMSAWRYTFVVSADSCPSQRAITERSTP